MASRKGISIHAPLAGCDLRPLQPPAAPRSFQSTHPLRGATRHILRESFDRSISIHAPLAGCDMDRRMRDRDYRNFNPRTPCGVRPCARQCSATAPKFQSTHPLRGATGRQALARAHLHISIHAPLAGCDIGLMPCSYISCNFNPRTPCGVRRLPRPVCLQCRPFQSTHPLRGATTPL